jgi:mannosyltransferase
MSRITRYTDAASVLLPTLLIAITATVSALRLPLWRDELATMLFAKQDWADLPAAVSHVDAVFGPYYAVTRVVYLVIPTTFGLRLLPLVAAIGTVLITTIVARRWWGAVPALVAGVVLATNPLFQQMASTARSYAIATFFIALAVLLLDRALRKGRVISWVGYGLAVAAAGYAHLFALLSVPALIVYAIGVGRRRLVTALVATFVAGLIVLPVVFAAYAQRGQVSWILRPTLRSGLGAFASALVYRSEGRFETLEAVVLLVTVAVLVAGIVLTLRMPTGAARSVEFRRFGLALVLAFAPWIILFAVSLVSTPFLRTNYLTPSLVGLALAFGATSARFRDLAASTLRRRPLVTIATVIALLAVIAVPAGRSAIEVTAPWRVDDFPGLAAKISRVVHTGDVIVFVQPPAETGVDAGSADYLGDTKFFTETIDRVTTGKQPVLDLRRVTDTDPVTSVSTVSIPSNIPSDATVWIVNTRGAYTAADGRALGKRGIACAAPSRLKQIGAYGLMRLEQVHCG